MVNKDKIYELVNDFDVAMMTNIDENGKLVSHPMTLQNEVKDDVLWFFTHKDSEKVTELKKQNAVNIAFHDGDSISISGHVQMIDDVAKKKELWSKELEAFYKGGPESDEIILLKVNVDSLEYWTADNKLKSAFEFVKGMVTDDIPEDIGEHDAIEL